MNIYLPNIYYIRLHCGSQCSSRKQNFTQIHQAKIFTKGYLPEMWAKLMESVRDTEAPRDQEQKEAIITPKHEGLRGINSDMELHSIWNHKTGPLVKTCNSGGILRLSEMVPKQGRSRDKIPVLSTPALQSYSLGWALHTLRKVVAFCKSLVWYLHNLI